MKKRNKKYLQEKEFLAIKNKLDDNRYNQYMLGYIELDIPYHRGYIMSLVLRYDISNRVDSWIFQYIIDNFSTTFYMRKKNIPDKDIKYPYIRDINEKQYNELPVQIKKYFTKNITNTSPWKSNFYYCNVPIFYFDTKINKNWVYKEKVFDEILLREEAELESILYNKFYIKYFGESVPKHFRKMLNKSERSRSKQILFNILNGKELEFVDNYKSARWLWW